MHNDTAPWTGWLRIAVVLLQCSIFLATVTVTALGAASPAVIERQWNLQYLEQINQTSLPENSYASTHELKVRIQLACFYLLAPLAILAFITGEAWCLLTNELAPLYVAIASVFSVFVWAMELGFWTACQTNSDEAVPDLCPVIFKNGKDFLFTIAGLGPAEAAVYVAAVLLVLYLAYALLGGLVFHRERQRDKQRKWIGAQQRISLLERQSDKEARCEAAREETPVMESRASLAQVQGERPRIITWE